MTHTKRFAAVMLSLMLVIMGAIFMPNSAMAASKVSINTTNLVVREGQSRTLKISGIGKKVRWRTSDSSVATVSSGGKVRAKKAGTSTITGRVNRKNYTCTVRVSDPDTNVLVAYFSYSGTTKSVAQKIRRLTGGDIVRIREKTRYSTNYDRTASRAQREMQNNSRPAITTTVANMKDYDVVYIGYPIWWHSTPKVIDTFLEKYDLSGKTVIPFCTSGGSDISESMDVIQSLCKSSTILEGYTADSGSTGEVRRWLRSIGMLDNGAEAPSEPTQPSQPSEPSQPSTDSKTLVAYFSWSGNTTGMASYIADQIGADLLELQPANPYPTDYTETGNIAKDERDTNTRPTIANLPDSIEQYDTIFIGYPIWWHTAPMIIGTFLESYDLSNVEIYPFTQSASMDTEQFDNSMEFVRTCAKNANVHDGLFVRSSDTAGISSYLTANGFIK